MTNTSDFTERLQKVIKYYDETASSFAEKIGVQRSSISHILSGRNKPSLDFVMKVLHTYTEVDLYWLMNGKGQFPSTPKKEQLKFSDSNPEESTEFVNSNNSSEIEKIIILYKDGSFKSYQN
ncbi:MAG: helix-turn-helix transcriptional regulator [Winogradskyella sp.]|uniref:helix-turn-helix domain-containing protein n=1 Tax=Winogradskyella sp. TaxID=1883156 RepID=UPI00183E097B|nr:helix-turn-helix transcriptional regulator [Winogradskyella sp.]MBT8245564.1 helix-turn-helix domain-containing protein [Winogradskyella sp.]NNK22577.1 helix-turn-helix transcriptional regulator [Winogradskyella sp.]